MVMPLGALIALALPLAAKASFVCDAAAVETQPAESLLRGHHLTTLDYAWPLFATKNASAPSGWSGLDIEILDKLSSRLGFTYDVKEMTTLSGESWGAMLERMTLEADLVLSYRILVTNLLAHELLRLFLPVPTHRLLGRARRPTCRRIDSRIWLQASHILPALLLCAVGVVDRVGALLGHD